MSEQDQALLLSIRPRFADSIMAGTKSVEIRRQRPAVQPGTSVIVYATAPVAAIVGMARVVDVAVGKPAGVWSRYHVGTDLTREEYDTYLAGAASASALILTDAERLSSPVTLADIRAVAPFQPPRSYRYIKRDALRRFINGHAPGRHLLSRCQ